MVSNAHKLVYKMVSIMMRNEMKNKIVNERCNCTWSGDDDIIVEEKSWWEFFKGNSLFHFSI